MDRMGREIRVGDTLRYGAGNSATEGYSVTEVAAWGFRYTDPIGDSCVWIRANHEVNRWKVIRRADGSPLGEPGDGFAGEMAADAQFAADTNRKVEAMREALMVAGVLERFCQAMAVPTLRKRYEQFLGDVRRAMLVLIPSGRVVVADYAPAVASFVVWLEVPIWGREAIEVHRSNWGQEMTDGVNGQVQAIADSIGREAARKALGR